MLVQVVLGEVIGETERTVLQDEVLVVSKVVGVVVSGVVVVTVGTVGVVVEGGPVVGEVGPVVVSVGGAVGPGVEPGDGDGVLPTDEVMNGDVVPGDDSVLGVVMIVTGVLGRVMDSVGGEEVD